MLNRESVNSLLKKFGVANPSNFNDARAEKKLMVRLAGAEGVTFDIDESERAEIEALGYSLDTKADDAKDASSAAGLTDGSTEVVAASGEGKKAKKKKGKKNKKTKPDDRSANAPAEEGKKKSKKSKKPKKNKSKESAEEKPPVKTKSAKSNKPRHTARDGHEIFAALFASGKPVLKSFVTQTLTESGVNPKTIPSYFSWAKRPVSYALNTFGIQITEFRNENDEKVVQCIATATPEEAKASKLRNNADSGEVKASKKKNKKAKFKKGEKADAPKSKKSKSKKDGDKKKNKKK